MVPQHQVWTAPLSGKYVEGLSSIVTAIMSFTIVKFFYILFTTVKAFYQRQIPSVTTAIIIVMICLFVCLFVFILKLLQYCNYIIIVMQIKLMLLLLLLFRQLTNPSEAWLHKPFYPWVSGSMFFTGKLQQF